MTQESTGQGESSPSSSRPSGDGPVSSGSHKSGRADTPWELQGGTRRGRFWKMLVASAVFHVFLTPGPALLGLVAMLPALELGEPEELIEVDLTAIPVGPTAPEPTPPPDEPDPAEPSPENPVQSERDPVPDPPEPAPQPEAPEEAPPEAPEEAVPKETEAFGDPVALAGPAGAIADSNANVRMYLFTEVVREHPLGARIGELLRRTPQWSDFFGPSNIDPIEDIDRVLIAGPQLRKSSNVVAVVKHRMGRDRIRMAFEGLVATKGEWIDRDALIAKAHADRADRLFAAPNDEVVIVAPLHLESQVRKMGSEATFPPSAKDVAVSAYIVTPANVAKGTGIQLPKSLKWARLDLRPTPDGGAVLKILAQDESPQSAADHARFFEDLIRALTMKESKDMGLLGWGLSKAGVKQVKYIQSVKFHSEEDKIHGELVVNQTQLTMAAGFLDGYLPQLDEEGKRTGRNVAPDASDAGRSTMTEKSTPAPAPPAPQDQSPVAPPSPPQEPPEVEPQVE